MISVFVPHPRTVRFAERACGHDAIQRVLAVVDPDGFNRAAVDKAERLAMAFGATLELYACERDASVDADEALITHAIRTGASLVVKDLTAAVDAASSTADDVLIAQLPMPLLLVRAEPWGAHPRVAASVDPCRPFERPIELDESVVGLGASVSRALGGVSFAVHVLEGPPHLPGEVVSPSERRAAFEQQRAQVLALGCLTLLDDREVHFVEQRVPDGIARLANETQSAILAIGVAARPRADALGGETARELLRQTACDLLVVKPAGFVSAVMVRE